MPVGRIGVLPQAKPAIAGFIDRAPLGAIHRTGAVGLLVVAALLLIAAPAHAAHGGADATTIQPPVSVPGGAATIDIEAGESPYVATDILLPAPVVDGEQLTFDVEATNATYGVGDWTVDEAASTDEEIRFRWRTVNNTLESADDSTVAWPSPPDQLEVVLNGTQPVTEGNATWEVQFCLGEWFDSSGTLEETVGDVPVSVSTDAETGLYLCLDGHIESVVSTFDNKAPEMEVTLSDAEGHSTSPFYKEAVLNVTATDNGSGIKLTAIGNKASFGEPTVEETFPSPGQDLTVAAQDNVFNLNQSSVTFTVVDGVAVATNPQGASFDAGEVVTVVADYYRADPSGAFSHWMPSATGDVSVELVDGPDGADIEQDGPASDAIRTFNFTATTAGAYTLNVTGDHVPDDLVDPAASVDVEIEPALLDTIEVSPSSATVVTGGVVQFDASGEDAYGNAVDHPWTWKTSCGVISPSGEFVAPSETGTCTVAAEHHNGQELVTDEVEVTVQSPVDAGDGDDGSNPTGLSVSDLRSPSHDVDVWSSVRGIEMAWDAPDADLSGYAFTLTRDDSGVGTDPATTETQISVKAGDDGSYTFKVRPIADDGTPGDVATYGPIKIDTEGPMPPHDAEAALVDDGLEIAWSELTARRGSPIVGYTVDRMPDDGSWDRLAEVTDGSAFVDDQIPAPGTYHYRLRSLDAAGNLGPSSKWVTVQLDEIPGSSSSGDVPASVGDLYQTLGIEPGDATFEDRDGDGVADGISGDDRLSLERVTSIGDLTAYLITVEDQDAAALMTPASKAYPVTQEQAEISSEKAGKNGLVVTAKAGSTSGWTLTAIPDDHPDLDLKGVFDADRDRLPEDRYWRLDGTIAVLDDGSGTYMLMYTEPGGSGRSLDGQPATPGPGVLVAVAGLVAAAAWVARRRDP